LDRRLLEHLDLEVIDDEQYRVDTEHLDMVVIGVVVHGEDWFDDDVATEAFGEPLDGVRRGIEENMGVEDEVKT